MAVAAGALKAQQSRMRVIAENIANAQSTSPVAG
ncbi:MAG: flagellar basal body protein, partial [Brevundimonas sp.]|nr:flagellar basal body protein [Brevundimonas sp.]